MMDVNITPFSFCVSGSHQVCVLSPSSVFQTPPLFLSILTYFGLPQKQTGKCEQNWFIWRNGVELGWGVEEGKGRERHPENDPRHGPPGSTHLPPSVRPRGGRQGAEAGVSQACGVRPEVPPAPLAPTRAGDSWAARHLRPSDLCPRLPSRLSVHGTGWRITHRDVHLHCSGTSN